MTESTPPPRRPLATFLRSESVQPAASAPSEATAAMDTAAATGPETPAPAAAAQAPPRAPVAAATPPHSPATRPNAEASVPTFARRPRHFSRTRATAWQWTLLLLLCAALSTQLVLADRARLAADARWRPALSTLCAALRCALPAWREPAAFTMLERDVRPIAAAPGVLRVQASFRNDARWEQAWPWLQLSLSDADGRLIGRRAFAPRDYLGHAPAAHDRLAPGQSARIDFHVREPSADTAAFAFEFR